MRRVPLATGVALRVIAAGPETGDPVLMVHGWGIHAYLWRRNIAPLVAAGRRVYAVDLPGHGLSDRPDAPGGYTLPQMAAHISALCDALSLSRVALVAQSMGGRIALEVARATPQRVSALALFGSVGFGEVPSTVKLARYLPAPRGQLPAMLIQRWMVALGKGFAYGRRASVRPEDIDAYWAATQFPEFIAAARQALIEFDWRPLTPADAAMIAIPTLVVFGTRDRTVRPVHAASLVTRMPNASLHFVRDAGHVANEETWEEINPLLVEFISRAK